MAHYSTIEDGTVVSDYPLYSERTGFPKSSYSKDSASGETLRHPGGFYQRYVKRALDVTVVVLAAPFVLSVIFLLALLIRRDGGSAFYSQDRVGLDGGVFRCWKLRSMIVDADARMTDYLAENADAHAEWSTTQKLTSDPRITPVGRLLRKASLDELPQLWNVLCGDMSLVGPRPMMPDQRPLYPGRAYYRLRPGLTGFWQISDRNQSSFSHRAVYDTCYAQRISFITDILVLLMTVRTVVRGTGY